MLFFSVRLLLSPVRHLLLLWLPYCPCVHCLPTRRSSDLQPARSRRRLLPAAAARLGAAGGGARLSGSAAFRADRKSTRLNSSHLVISYAVFCLKKKKK